MWGFFAEDSVFFVVVGGVGVPLRGVVGGVAVAVEGEVGIHLTNYGVVFRTDVERGHERQLRGWDLACRVSLIGLVDWSVDKQMYKSSGGSRKATRIYNLESLVNAC